MDQSFGKKNERILGTKIATRNWGKTLAKVGRKDGTELGQKLG